MCELMCELMCGFAETCSANIYSGDCYYPAGT